MNEYSVQVLFKHGVSGFVTWFRMQDNYCKTIEEAVELQKAIREQYEELRKSKPIQLESLVEVRVVRLVGSAQKG